MSLVVGVWRISTNHHHGSPEVNLLYNSTIQTQTIDGFIPGVLNTLILSPTNIDTHIHASALMLMGTLMADDPVEQLSL